MSREATPRLGSWHEGRDRRPVASRTKASKWLGIALASLSLTVVIVLAWYLIPWSNSSKGPQPFLASYWVGEFQKAGRSHGDELASIPSIPSIPWMNADREAMSAARVFSRGPAGDANPTLEVMRTGLGALSQHAPAGSLVVYLATSATVGEDDAVRIFAADSDPDDVDTLLTLREVLYSLKACPDRRKLLVLDLARAPDPADVRRGVDDLFGRIRAEVEAAGDDRLLVLCSCSAGEVSLGSEILRQSVFNHYFRLGLEGGADVDRDREVSVKELASYLGREVDRWAQSNRGTRQRPALIGSGDDFALVAVKDRKKAPPRPPAKLDYPGWLTAGWARLDALRKAGDFRLAPRVYRTMESDLLAAERDWRGGLEGRLLQRQGELEAARDIPRPPRYSVGLDRALGGSPDPDLVAALKDVLLKRRVPEPFATPEQIMAARTAAEKAFLEKLKLKGKDSLPLGRALVAAVGDEPKFDTDTVQFLDSIVRNSQLPLDLVETRFLRQMAVRSGVGTPSDWSSEVAKIAWEVRCLAEEANYQPHALPWVRNHLDEAAARLHAGEVFLLPRANDYVSWGKIDETWKQASDAYSFIDRTQKTIRDAQLMFARSMAVLPASVAYLELSGDPEAERNWLETVKATRHLHETLQESRAETDGRDGLSREELDRLGNELKVATSRLEEILDDLLRPFQPESLGKLISRSKSDPPDPSLVREIDATLATPFPTAPDRAKLWEAGLNLARRLATRANRSDDPVSISDTETDADRMATLRKRGVQRARRALALLSLTGQETDDLAKALGAPPTSGPDDPLKDLSNAGRVVDKVHARLRDPSRGDEQGGEDDLDGWVAPVFTLDLKKNPIRERSLREAQAALAWLAGHYRHEGRDLDDPDTSRFYENAALESDAGAEAEAYLDASVEAAGREIVLDDKQPVVEVNVAYHLLGTEQEQEVEISAVGPDVGPMGRLRVEVTSPPMPVLMKHTAPTRVTLKCYWDEQQGRAESRPPAGIILQARLKDKRAFHTRIPLTISQETDRLRLALGNGVAPPITGPFDLSLRPIGGRQPYFLSVRNPSDAPREVLVEILSGTAMVPVGTVKLPVNKGSTEKVTTFGPPVLKPTDPLPELNGPLLVRLKDASNGQVLDERRIAVEIADPSSYVEVTRARFVPARDGQPNRLEVAVRPLAGLTGPPCPVELVLPGMTTAKVYQLKAKLEPGGDEETLFAEGLSFDPAVGGDIRFALNIDGRERALWYRVNLAGVGEPRPAQVEPSPRVGFDTLRVVKPGQPARLKVDFRVDNEPRDATLQWRIRQLDARIGPPTWSSLAKNRRIGFDARGEGGALLFEASIEDWSREFDTQGFRGARSLEARLLDAEGKVLDTHETMTTLDDLAPQGVTVKADPRRVPKGTRDVSLTANAIPPASGIKGVEFFVGKPADFAKQRDAGPLTQGRSRGDDSVWEGSLQLPRDAAGPVVVSVRVVSGVDLEAFSSAEVDVFEPKPDPAADGNKSAKPAAPGSIVGRVIQGNLGQPDRTVFLYNQNAPAPAKPLQTTTTTREGKFEFKKVEPGTYKVDASNEASRTYGKAEPVVVEPGKRATADLDLLRR